MRPTDDLVAAGGLLGVAAAGPLASGLAPWGAGLILAAIGIGGLVVLTRVPVRVAAETTAAATRPAGAAVADTLRRVGTHLFSLGSSGDERRTGPPRVRPGRRRPHRPRRP